MSCGVMTLISDFQREFCYSFSEAASELPLAGRSAFLKELLQNGFAVFPHHAAQDGGLMIEPNIAGDLKHSIAGTAFRVGRSVDDKWKPRLHDRSCTHRAGFQSDV